MDTILNIVLSVSRWLMPLLSVWLLLRCLRSMLREKYEPELWGWLDFSDGTRADLRHWECIIGRAKSCDVVINNPNINRTHAALTRSDGGVWHLYDLNSDNGTANGTLRDYGNGLEVSDGDILFFADCNAVFHSLTDSQLASDREKRSLPGFYVSQSVSLLLLTLLQVFLVIQLTLQNGKNDSISIALAFAVVCLTQWALFFLMRAVNREGFEPEILAFFLCTLGMAVTATAAPSEINKQIVLFLAGVLSFLLLGWWLRDLNRTRFLRWPLAIIALAFLAINAVAGTTTYGATNWLSFGGVTLQPSEFVKVAFVYVGASSLDRLYRKRSLFLFIAFSAICVGALALMGDFGTALIFFATFLIIAFMRSGSFATVFLAIAGAAFAGFLVLTIKPYIAQRFSTWGHVWEDPYGAGWQQTRALSAAACGGLLGKGAGRGWLHTIFAADTDMVFCLISEELGLIIAITAMLSLIIIALFSVRAAANGRSSYYVIAACASASMLLVQLALNVFGSTDLLPFTGVTFPFVSRGGSSLISCWMLLAFIKSADTRRNSSFSVRLSTNSSQPDYSKESDSSDQEEVADE